MVFFNRVNAAETHTHNKVSSLNSGGGVQHSNFGIGS